MTSLSFKNIIENKVSDNHLLNHSFYKAWNAGELKIETIQEYAAQYFNHVSAFPRYLSGIHTNCEDISIRQELLDNLIEEEKGEENHPELWLRFGEGMGKPRDAILNSDTIKETDDLVNTFMKLSRDERTHIGMAALYCYESMVPEVAENKISSHKPKTISILGSLKKELANEEENKTPIKSDQFTEVEFSDAWKEMNSMFSKMGKTNLSLALTSNTPNLSDNFLIEITLSNTSQIELIQEEKMNLLGFLRKRLNNDLIDLIPKVIQSNIENTPYTNSDKFKKMCEQNKNLAILGQKLGLDPDY